LPIAVLLEGVFPSAFTNRPLSAFNNNKPFHFRDRSIPTRMIVISNADIIRNEISRRADGAYITPLGFDRYTNQTYGNKELIMNMINYLYDDAGLLNLRTREFKLRLLDKNKVLQNRVRLQVFNLVFPSVILLIFVAIWLFVRRRRYTK
jgi:ABC-2 type transport system permease protein